MPLSSGTKLGPYEIVAQIGAGGMGEVYKAADTRLNRTVAIKVLPAHFSENLEMKQRLEREAQTIASLNHPHICTLYDVGRQDQLDFLVMEYLEGESLAQRLLKGPLPLDEALKVGIAIADALDKAHGHGVTHRDLKPGNVMLTPTGAKLLDFGLAKLRQAPTSSKTPPPAPATGETTPGTILGTMQYMAPEQLEGKEADARTDIFAFGAMLYEMISGKRAFDGRSQALLIASIMSVDPDPPSKTQPGAPPALDFLIKRCLAKDPEERLQTAWDLMCHLQWIAEGGTASGTFAALGVRKTRNLILRGALAFVALLIAVLTLPALRYLRGSNGADETRFAMNLPDMPVPEALSVSPDGRWIAYSGRDGGTSFVFARAIGSETPTKLLGTEGAGRLFWSPDSRWIGFFAGGKLKKIEAAGGPPQNICETPDLLGGTWNSEDTILFASSKGLQRVMAAGGDPSAVPVGDTAGVKRIEPSFLPDGRHYLYLGGAAQGSGSAIYGGSIDSKDSTLLVKAESNGVYADPGYLLYHREGTLYAQPFNPGRLSLTGEAIRIADKVPAGSTGAGAFAASKNGILVFRNNPPTPAQSGTGVVNVYPAPLLWISRTGKTEQAAAQAGWTGVDLSPDGKHVAAHRHDPDGGDVWIFETGKDTPSKFTFDASLDNSAPVWAPDGKQIAFASRRNGKWGLYIKVADNTKNEEPLWESDMPAVPMSWSPDGKLLVFWASSPKTGGDIWALALNGANANPTGRGNQELSGEKKPIPILQTPADERHPQVSPDGKWIAYSSNETGRSEVYIKSFPEGPAKIQVSVNGGVYPRWRRDGKELYFMNLVSVGAMMGADIKTSGESIQRDVPHVLFQTVYVNSSHPGGIYLPYAVSANGQQFLMSAFENAPALYSSAVVARGRGATLTALLPSVASDRHSASGSSSVATTPLMIVLNWTSGLNVHNPR